MGDIWKVQRNEKEAMEDMNAAITLNYMEENINETWDKYKQCYKEMEENNVKMECIEINGKRESLFLEEKKSREMVREKIYYGKKLREHNLSKKLKETKRTQNENIEMMKKEARVNKR